MIQAARCRLNQTQQRRVAMTQGRCRLQMICPTE
jgi:hypothetical protein